MAPLNNTVWILTGLSAFIAAIALFYVSVAEQAISPADRMNIWPSLGESWRYCFGVLLGEFIVPSMQWKTRNLPSLRYINKLINLIPYFKVCIFIRVLLCVWSLGCLVISCSYAGSLKAHLTMPTLANNIDSLEVK